MALYDFELFLEYVCYVTMSTCRNFWGNLDKQLMIFKIKGNLTFDLYLHNEDGVAWLRPYFEIRLSCSIEHVHQIGGCLEEQFPRFKTKENVTLTSIYIMKIVLWDFDLNLKNECHVTIKTYTKFGFVWTHGSWDTIQR